MHQAKRPMEADIVNLLEHARNDIEKWNQIKTLELENIKIHKIAEEQGIYFEDVKIHSAYTNEVSIPQIADDLVREVFGSHYEASPSFFILPLKREVRKELFSSDKDLVK